MVIVAGGTIVTVGRFESPLAGDDRQLIAFAEGLRRLRQQIGSPSYRDLAKRAHYSASALSQAANGRALPTLAVTLAFVNACGGDPEEWARRWTEVAATVAGNPGTETLSGSSDIEAPTTTWRSAEVGDDNVLQPATAPPHVADQHGGSRPEREHAEPAQRRKIRSRLLAVSLLAVPVVFVAGVMASVPGGDAPRKAAPACGQPGAPDPIEDGCDPNRAGCSPDAVTMSSTAVHFPADELSGDLELRYSPHCQAAWVRFTPSESWHPGPGVAVTVWTIRPADQASQEYTVEFGGESIIGNILLTRRGCIVAEVTMERGSARSPVATTTCWVFGTPAANSQ